MVDIVDLLVVCLLHFATLVSIFLDIPYFRQVLGFIYLTFLPGFVVLKALGLEKEDLTRRILWGVGLSISFLMLLGLLMNNLYPLFGIEKPLTLVPVFASIVSFVLIVSLAMKKHTHGDTRSSDLALQTVLLMPLLLIAAFGTLFSHSPILVVLLLGITAVYAFIAFTRRIADARLLPGVILVLSICLVLQTSLIWRYLMSRSDIYIEHYVFKMTKDSGLWNPPGTMFGYNIWDNIESLLSTTILPTIYAVSLNMSGEFVFKLVYPLLFALVPLALYKTFEREMGESIAFVATVFLISSPLVFYGTEMVNLARQMIGELFFALSVMTILDDKLDPLKKKILLTIFGFSLTVSYYSLAFIYLLFLGFAFFRIDRSIDFVFGRKRKFVRGRHGWLLAFMIVMVLAWYTYVSNSPMNQMTKDFRRIYQSFYSDLFDPEARVGARFLSLSPLKPSPIIGQVHKVVIYVQQLLIVVGFVTCVMLRRTHVSQDFSSFSTCSAFILFLCLAVPNFSSTLNFSRLYQIAALLLSPFFVLGGLEVIGLAERRMDKALGNVPRLRILSILLVVSFLFDSGLINHLVGGYPYSFSLDNSRRRLSDDMSLRISYYGAISMEQDVYSSRWLSESMNEESIVYADRLSGFGVLTGYALLSRDKWDFIRNGTIPTSNSYLYLSFLNVHEGVVTHLTGMYNLSDIHNLLESSSKIYSNGGSHAYLSP